MSGDVNAAARKTLKRLGVEDDAVKWLERFAAADDVTLAEYVAFVLRTYQPPDDVWREVAEASNVRTRPSGAGDTQS